MIQVLKNGIEYLGWKDINVSRSLINLCSKFTITSSVEYLKEYPIKANDEITIFVNDVKFFTGFVELIPKSVDAFSNDIQLSGRDRTSNLLDSSLDGNLSFSVGTSLKVIIETVISNIGSKINVIDKVGAGVVTEKIEVSVGENAFDFLKELAQKKQVFLISNIDGDLEIIRSETQVLPNILLLEKDNNQTNIKDAGATWDLTKRFNKYIVVSQTSYNKNNRGEVADTEILTGRQLVILTDSTLNKDECAKRALFEKNNRKAQGFRYDCSVVGFTYDGINVYELNNLIKVIDGVNDINAKLLIDTLSFDVSNEVGAVTTISLVDALSYGIAEEDEQIEDRTNKGSNYVEKA